MAKKQKFREVNKTTQGHTAREGWSQDSTLVYLSPTTGLFPLTLDSVGHLLFKTMEAVKRIPGQHVKSIQSSGQRALYLNN